jgi:hypothetical protein
MRFKYVSAALLFSLALSPTALAGNESGVKTAAEIANPALHNTETKTTAQVSNPSLHNTELKTSPEIANPALHNTELKTAQVTSYIYPETYGAKGNGTTDDSAAIQQAFTRAKSASNSAVLFSAKTYACANQVSANGASVLGASGAKVLFTNSASGGIVLTGNKPSLSSITLSYANSASNSGVGLYINNASNFQVSNVTIGACPSDNIDCFSSSTGSISHCTVSASSPSKSALLIEDCSGVTVSYNVLPNFAVIQQSSGSTNLNISYNQFSSSAYPSAGYGVKLAGLTNSTFSHNSISCGYVQIGSSYNYAPTNITQTQGSRLGPGGRSIPTYSYSGTDGNISNLTVSYNTIDGTNTTGLSGKIELAMGIWVQNGNPTTATVNSLVVSNNTISNLPCTLSGIFLDQTVSNSQITQNNISSISDVLNGTSSYCDAINVGSGNNISVTRNAISNISGVAICGAPNNTNSGATLTISNNTITNAGTNPSNTFSGSPGSDPADTSVIAAEIYEGASAVTITNNTYKGPANGLYYFIFFTTSISGLNPTISGNLQTTTVLPNDI